MDKNEPGDSYLILPVSMEYALSYKSHSMVYHRIVLSACPLSLKCDNVIRFNITNLGKRPQFFKIFIHKTPKKKLYKSILQNVVCVSVVCNMTIW